ncbi:hypothetical protein Vretimale_17226 [Volvox reticuliferus]|uniref:Uncharacterized protein n=1 Tax=Volvox reticuliferus TaxID=1737510 RepID=A0A8J4GV76_9CHLO|nr:hypothetical protein Vretimale_17226 [Volvox reticuliferus]
MATIGLLLRASRKLLLGKCSTPKFLIDSCQRQQLCFYPRVRALKSKECIPVERQHQQDFISLLRAIFESGSTLQQLYEDIAWALNTLEPAASWEDRLQPILAVLASCQAYEACLNQQDQLLARPRFATGPQDGVNTVST